MVAITASYSGKSSIGSHKESIELLTIPGFIDESEIVGDFFGRKVKKIEARFSENVTLECLDRWREMGLDLHVLPAISLSKEDFFPCWKNKPDDWFYKQVEEKKILGTPTMLNSQIILFDSRSMPSFKSGFQMYEEDFLAPVMLKLREESRLLCNPPCPIKSRFCVTWFEYLCKVAPEIARYLGLESRQVRLPRFIELNYLGNCFYNYLKEEKGTSEWLWDVADDNFHYLATDDLSRASFFNCHDSESSRGFRPFIILDYLHC